MNELLNIIRDYVFEKDAEYAILITGDWGCGKTFFWKNDINKSLKSLNINIRPIYVSLFGINNVNEIIDKIILQYYFPKPPINAFFSALRNSITKMLKIDNFKDIVHDLFSFKNIVICFDDLERSVIPIQDILGYINSLIDHNKFRVIIICNEDEILEDNRPENDKLIYNKFKEKTIGFTYEFMINYDNVVNNIISSYTKSHIFHNYLMSENDIIINTFKASETKNIRLLKHSIATFYKIFHYLIAIDTNLQQEFGKKLLIYTLGMSFELRRKKPTEDKLKEIKAYITDDYPMSLLSDREKDQKLFTDEFIDKYYKNLHNYIYTSQTIFNYILNGSFDVREFIIEIEKQRQVEDPEKADIKNILHGYWSMSDEEFKKISTNILKDQIKLGKINSLALFIKLFLLYLKFIDSGIINIDKEELTNSFKMGMELAYSEKTLRYASIDESLLWGMDNKYLKDDKYLEINTIAQKINDKVKDELIKDKCIQCFEYLNSNVNQFVSTVNSDILESLLFEPCFKYIKPKTLFKKIINLCNNDLILFRNSIVNRYKINVEGRDSLEKDTFLKLKKELETYVKNREQKLSTHLYKVLISTLDEICKNT